MRIAADTTFVQVVSGTFHRMIFKARVDQLLQPARSPEGRWHHSGQNALYLSETPEGCYIASRMYMAKGDPDRQVFPVQVQGARVLNLRDEKALRHHNIDAGEKHCMWHEHRAAGRPSPTWAISDAIRALGFDGMLTPSRSRPDLTHLTLFRWNADQAPSVTANAGITPN